MFEIMGVELLKHNLKTLNDLVIDGLVNKWEEFDTQYNKNFKRYFEKSFEKNNRIRTILSGEPQKLVEVFQPTSLYENNRSEKEIESDRILETIRKERYLWITGYGGIGKSTLLKYIMLSILIEEKNSKNKIPVYVELRKYNLEEEKRRTFKEFIYNQMFVLGFKLDMNYFIYMLKNGRFLFLLDAYDEVSSQKMDLFLTELEEFITEFDENDIVITSRKMNQDYLDNFGIFKQLKTKGLKKNEAMGLIEKVSYDQELKIEFINDLDNSLFDEYKSLASNPVLLQLMLSVFRENNNFPTKKSVFLIKSFEELFENHDGRKIGYQREFKCEGIYKLQMMDIFAAFCYLTYFGNNATKNEFSESEIINIIQQVIENFKWLENSQTLTVDNLLNDLTLCLCILYKEGANYYFVHNIYQEFFAAYYIFKKDKDAQTFFVNKHLYEGEAEGNSRLIETTLDYMYELDSVENQSIMKFNFLLPLLELIESDSTFIDYHYFYEIFMFKYKKKADKIFIYNFYIILNSHKSDLSKLKPKEVLSHLYRLCYSKNHAYQDKIIGSISLEEFEKIVSRIEDKEEYSKSRSNHIEISYSDIMSEPQLYELYKKTYNYEKLERIKTLKNQLKEEQLIRNKQNFSLF